MRDIGTFIDSLTFEELMDALNSIERDRQEKANEEDKFYAEFWPIFKDSNDKASQD